MNSKHVFVFVPSCGCAISKALFEHINESNTNENQLTEKTSEKDEIIEKKLEDCPNCGKHYDKEELVVINPANEDLYKSQLSNAQKKASKSKRKKSKKDKKSKSENSSSKKKKLKVPEHANPETFKSIFVSSMQKPKVEETFLCRNVSRI